MKRLMFRWPLMAEAGEGGGGAAGGGAAGAGAGGQGGQGGAAGAGAGGEGGQGGAAGGAGTGAAGGAGTGAAGAAAGTGAAGGAGTGAAGAAAGGEGGEPKPFLGDGGGKPKPASDEDYAKALVKDEALLGDDKNIQLDAELYKACVPVMQKYGVTPEAANALANALAKAQIDDARARMQSRVEYFEKMKQESLRTYTPKDFETINAGIDRWFKPGGIMNSVIRNSELGADPEFLALMHYLGKAVAEDGGEGVAGGSGGGGGDPNGEQGMSSIW